MFEFLVENQKGRTGFFVAGCFEDEAALEGIKTKWLLKNLNVDR